MTANKSNPIIGIMLEGFQVFEKPTYIPLDRLTLLFGPNSAGKSAVQDAIDLYAALMSRETAGSYMQFYEAKALLARHWRRTGCSDDSRVDKLSIGVVHTTQVDIHSVLEYQLERKIWGEFLARNGHAWELENRWYFERYEQEGEDIEFTTRFEFLIESVMLVKHSNTELQLNLKHPLLSQTELKVDFAALAKTYPDEVTLDNGQLIIRGLFLDFHPRGARNGQHHDRWMTYHTSQGLKHVSNDKSTFFSAAIVELNVVLDCILDTAIGNSRFIPSKVDASRLVPSRQALTFQIGNLYDAMQQMPFPEEPIYRKLAESLASELTNVQVAFSNPADRRKYADAVNHALADHLFLEQGYRLDFDFRLLMSEANSKAGLIEGMGLDPSEFGFLVEIHLRDGAGRKHLFQDVGSGIGYLLPVLCAVYEKRPGVESTCFIQQPELHIHPALQAAMGDVFIEGCDDDSQILIETHSEHLLLRILKRIRQTHLQVAIAPELKINADDVCVLYFDPSPDGTTTVKHLRISEDGEFMDRWPRGFFSERDQELLDE
ncbi:DUF3696 domain-containing protein [Rhodoferax sp.]|uniref:DUF3696 domain-containing protein n=1 Tax=Rhodoferax sp. TaxID=50421 RepID=UPI002613DEFA|nr:DUF3696 domain-containing protein [Rhodoferax sp.]MDD2917524.1 DUF3696 domain-containing protein [Rhodoferax sp.]